MSDIPEYKNKWHTVVDAGCQKKTDKAVLLDVEGELLWIPLSQIHSSSVPELVEGETCDVEITQWIAKQKGIY